MKTILVSLIVIANSFMSFETFAQDGLAIGAKPEKLDLLLENATGKKTTIAQLAKNEGLVVVFSCNTCPFVVGSSEFEGWEKQYNDLFDYANEKGFGFVLVNSNEAKRGGDDSMSNMKKRAKAKSYKMSYLLDENSIIANEFGAKTTPHVYLLDDNLVLQYKGSIDNSWDSKIDNPTPYLKNAIDQQLKGSIDEKETRPVGCSIKRVNSKTK